MAVKRFRRWRSRSSSTFPMPGRRASFNRATCCLPCCATRDPSSRTRSPNRNVAAGSGTDADPRADGSLGVHGSVKHPCRARRSRAATSCRWRTAGERVSPIGTAYGKGFPHIDDYPYKEGRWYNPYTQNVLKGDYPVWGQHTFFTATASIDSTFESRKVPVATAGGEATADPNGANFFGDPDQFFSTNYFRLQRTSPTETLGSSRFDWQLRVAPVFNLNYLQAQELGVVSPDLTKGTSRTRNYAALEEFWGEMKIADLSPDYDFVSIRAGNQPFTSDFRGFIFSDTNRGCGCSGTTKPTATSSTSPFSTRSRGHEQPAQHVRRPAAEHVHRELLPAGLHLPRLHDLAELPLQPRPRQHALRQERRPRPPRPHRHCPRTLRRLVLPGSVGRRAHQPLQHFTRLLLGVRSGRKQPAGRPLAAHQRPHGRVRTVLRPRLGAFPHQRVLFVRRQGHLRRFGQRLRHDLRHPRVRRGGFQLLATPADRVARTSLVNRNSLVPDLRTSKFQVNRTS